MALWEEPNTLTVWVSSQTPYMDRITLFHIFGREVKVRTVGGACGGSFGSKLMSWPVQAQAALLSRATGRPVKLVMTKEEHLAAFTLRPGSRMRARVGLKRDGTVTAVSGDWLVDTGSYSMTTQAQVAVGLRRTADHGSLSQLESQDEDRLHQPERLGHRPRVRRPGAETALYSCSVWPWKKPAWIPSRC